MQQETPLQNCLTDEQLEALYDGDGTELHRLHLMHCANCQAKLAEFERLDTLVAQAIQPPPHLNERILAAVRRDAAESRPLFRRIWAFGGSAVAAAVLVVAGLSIWPTGEPSSPAVAQETAANLLHQDSVWYLEPKFDGRYQAGGGSAPSSQPDAKVRPVAHANGQAYTATANSGKLLPSISEQVWSIPPHQGTEFLKKVAETNHRTFEMQENDAYIIFSMALKDTEAQELADKLHARGWRLLSPALPQPNATDNVVFTESPMVYKLKLVKAEP